MSFEIDPPDYDLPDVTSYDTPDTTSFDTPDPIEVEEPELPDLTLDEPEPELPDLTLDEPEPELPDLTLDEPEPELPDLTLDEPEPELPVPMLDEPEPELPVPMLDEPEPELPVPMLDEPEPEPEPELPEPELDEPEPELDEPEPELPDPTLDEPEPELDEPEPELPEPELDEPEPELPEPELDEPEPELPDPTLDEPEPESPDPTPVQAAQSNQADAAAEQSNTDQLERDRQAAAMKTAQAPGAGAASNELAAKQQNSNQRNVRLQQATKINTAQQEGLRQNRLRVSKTVLADQDIKAFAAQQAATETRTSPPTAGDAHAADFEATDDAAAEATYGAGLEGAELADDAAAEATYGAGLEGAELADDAAAEATYGAGLEGAELADDAAAEATYGAGLEGAELADDAAAEATYGAGLEGAELADDAAAEATYGAGLEGAELADDAAAEATYGAGLESAELADDGAAQPDQLSKAFADPGLDFDPQEYIGGASAAEPTVEDVPRAPVANDSSFADVLTSAALDEDDLTPKTAPGNDGQIGDTLEKPAAPGLGEEMIKEERRSGLNVDLAAQKHGHKTDLRAGSGKDVQSAHMVNSSSVSDLADYVRDGALTVLLPKELHKAFDDYWKRWVLDIVEANPGEEVRVTVEQWERVLVRAADSVPELIGRTADTMYVMIHHELYQTLGLKPDQQLRLPWAK